MQQIYLLEIFVDNVRVFVTGEEERSSESKNLTVKIGFGPKTEIFIREHQLDPDYEEYSGGDNVNDSKDNEAANKTADEDLVTVDEHGKQGWTRKVRVGKSFLFPSYSDTVLTTLRDFPLEIEVWNDDDREMFVFAANGIMHWDKQFFEWLQDEDQPDELHESFCVKKVVPLKSDCCCKILGEITLILRLNAFGDSITTEFQATDNEDLFYIRSNKSPNVLQCTRLEPFDDLNFVTIGTIYDTVNLEDPTILGQDHVEVCTEFDPQPCSKGAKPDDMVCRRQKHDKNAEKNNGNIIRMGDIKGPCGNPNCELAHKVRKFLRNLDIYKEAAASAKIGDESKDPDSQNICGSCICKQEQWHRDGCPEKCVLEQNCEVGNEVLFKSKSKLETHANYVIVDDNTDKPISTMNPETPYKSFKGVDADGNVETRVCISKKCKKPECPENKCSTTLKSTEDKKYETQVNPLLFVPKAEHKDYYTYRDLQNQCQLCGNPSCDPDCMGRNSGDEEDNEKPSPYSQDFIVQNVTVKYDVHPTRPCSGCGCRCQIKDQTETIREETPYVASEPSISEEPKVKIQQLEAINISNLINEIRDRDKNANKIRGETNVDPWSDPRVDPRGTTRRDTRRESRDQTWGDDTAGIPRGDPRIEPKGKASGQPRGETSSQPRGENQMYRQYRDRPSPYYQLVYKALSDPKTLSAVEAETLRQQQLTCDSKNDKECKCDPQKPTPPCKTFDCKCLSKNIEYASRKMHKPYCPNYIHKDNCPVNKTDADEDNEDEEDEPEPLPYGLPPIQLGPCPVLGRPCTVPDGFARMYKVAAIPPQPPSWSDAGKICCSKEFERIKKAIEEYMKYEKDHDMRCINKFNIDTERRCCDKEQRLFALIGKGCCGSHKMALQDQYKDYKEKHNHT